MSPDLQLEQLLKVLVDRFGSARTLGEVYATTYALRAHREGRPLTLADVAAHTGIAKQNLSRWLKLHVESDQAVSLPHRVDGRMHEIGVLDPDYACRHLPDVAAVLDVPLDPPREVRLEAALRNGAGG
jgi:hypothetical protein